MKKRSVGSIIIASAIIWGAVMIGCSFSLKGTGCYEEIYLILSGGMIAHLLFVWAPMGIMFKKNKEEE